MHTWLWIRSWKDCLCQRHNVKRFGRTHLTFTTHLNDVKFATQYLTTKMNGELRVHVIIRCSRTVRTCISERRMSTSQLQWVFHHEQLREKLVAVLPYFASLTDDGCLTTWWRCSLELGVKNKKYSIRILRRCQLQHQARGHLITVPH